MLSPEYLDHLTDDIVELYNQLDAAICRDISRRLVKAGRMTDTAKWQAERLRDAGLLYDEVLAEVSRYTPATDQAIKEMFEEAGLVSTEAEIKEYARAGLTARSIRMSEQSLRILAAGMQKTAGEMKNLTKTTAIATQQAYINVCTMVEMQVENGMLDYNTAIRRAVTEASSEGLSVLYPSGHIDKIDVAIRRAGLTGVNQTMGKVSLQYAQEFGCDLMEITAHGGARPEHAVWQGKIVSLSGRKGYLSLDDIGYGTGPGFMGWNCRHNWNPFFEGISSRNWSEEALERLNEKTVEYNGEQISEYEASQIQRRMEREIRATKRQLSAIDEGIKASGDEALTNSLKEDFTKGSQKLRRQKDNLSDLLEQTGRLPDNARTQVQGFGRSQASKAAWANKKGIANIPGNAIIGSGRGNMSISAIDRPIEQRNTGKGDPNAILHFDRPLNERQKKLLEILPAYDSRATVQKKQVSMKDLAALTASTGDEFAVFTKGKERLVIRGNEKRVNINIPEAEKLAAEGYRWSGHTHPGTDYLSTQPSDGDYAILDCFKQENSVIYNAMGEYRTFERRSLGNV